MVISFQYFSAATVGFDNFFNKHLYGLYIRLYFWLVFVKGAMLFPYMSIIVPLVKHNTLQMQKWSCLGQWNHKDQYPSIRCYFILIFISLDCTLTVVCHWMPVRRRWPQTVHPYPVCSPQSTCTCCGRCWLHGPVLHWNLPFLGRSDSTASPRQIAW